jgi:hypothetical protein
MMRMGGPVFKRNFSRSKNLISTDYSKCKLIEKEGTSTKQIEININNSF